MSGYALTIGNNIKLNVTIDDNNQRLPYIILIYILQYHQSLLVEFQRMVK